MRASELRKIWHFHIIKLLFPSIFLWVLKILCLRNIHVYILRSKIYICIHNIQSMQFPFITYGMALYIILQYTDKTLTLRESIYASELNFFSSHFHILKRLFLSIFCWYVGYFVGTKKKLMTCLSA